MPSAASAKVEKQSTTNNSAINAVAANNVGAQGENVDSSSPIRQISLIIEHKIRNLEKRKSKLESYRDLAKTGKDLTADKKVAILKYDEVAMTLDFARELSKQIEKVISTSEKDLKKKQKKEETLKKQNETSKIRETLIIHDILHQLKNESVRNDFLAGTNGACKLEESDLDLLDAFVVKVTPNRANLNGATFKNVCQKAADHLALTIDGKQKEFETSTYANIKTILKSIQKSNYFEKIVQPLEDANENNGKMTNDDDNTDNTSSVGNQTNIVAADSVTMNQNTSHSPAIIYPDDSDRAPEQVNKIEAPSASAVPVPTFAPHQQQQNHGIMAPTINVVNNIKTLATVPLTAAAIPLAQGAPPAGVVQPTTVRAVEQAYFKQHQYIQQMRPLAEVLGGGHFHFLQESELDSPEAPINNVIVAHPVSDRQQTVQIGQPPSQLSPQQPTQTQLHNTAVDSNQFFPILHNTQTNSFPNAVAANHQIPQQPHIPGFVSNATISIPIPSAAQITVASSVQQQQVIANPSVNANPSLVSSQQQSFPASNNFVNPTDVAENSSNELNLNSNDMNEHQNNRNTWRDSYNSNKGSPESNEWNGIPGENGQQEDLNTWSSGNSNQRYNQYRHGPGNYRSSNNKTTFSKNPSNGYRGSGNFRSSSNKQNTFPKNNNGNANGNSNNYRGSGNNNTYRPSTNKSTFTKSTTNGYRG